MPVGAGAEVPTANGFATVGIAYRGVPVTLTDAPTIATDASTGKAFRVILGANRILGVPTNPSDGQMVIWEIQQDGVGGRTLTLASGPGGFKFGTDLTGITLSTSPNLVDLIGCRYNATANRWWVIAFLRGF